MIILAAAAQMTERTVLVLIIVSALFVFGLLGLIGMFLWKANDALQYGNFFVVALGITTVLMGFLVAVALLVSGIFTEPTQVLTVLSALFGAIVGLVGTYFGVKSSSDVAQRAQGLPPVGQPPGDRQPPPGGQPPGEG